MKVNDRFLTHKAGIGTALVMAVFALSAAFANGDAPKHDYVGAKKCKMCHKKEAAGAQYVKWQESKHSKAFEALASDKAKEVAKKLGIEDPQKSPKCLQCHSTAYDHGTEVAKNIATKKSGKRRLTVEEGVSCESCHGPGSDYKKKKIMKDRDAAIAAGLNPEPKKECVKCHNDKNPTWDPAKYKLADGSTTGFDFDQAFEKIKHPVPKK